MLPGSPSLALDLKVWPLFRYASDPARDEVRWTAFGPLIEFVRTPERRELVIRPLLRLRQRRGATHDDRADILFPLASTRWRDDEQTARFLLLTYRDADTPAERRLTFFPFVWYRPDAARGARLSVFPFYLDLPDFLGYDEVKVVMFPAYVRLTEPDVERRFYGFPLLSVVGGALGSGFRFFPFYGWKEIAGRERSRYVLWPFHVRSDRLVPGYGWEHHRFNFPFFAAIDGAGRTHRGWGVMGYTHTVDERAGYEAVGAPWPFAVRERRLGEEHYRTWRVAPFYGRSEHGDFRSRFVAWPFWRTEEQDAPDFHYDRTDVLLVLGRHVHQHGQHDESFTTIFGAWRGAERDGRRFGQTPALADAILPRNDGVLALWAPLWGLFRWDTNEATGTLDWNLGWGLLARERGRIVPPWHAATGSPSGASDGR